MASRSSYQPLPRLLPRCLDAAATFVRRRGNDVPEWPLGLTDSSPARPYCDARLLLPTDVLTSAWRQLFPAERMIFIAGRRDGPVVRATSLRDVTGETRSHAYVKASAALLHEALLDWEGTGARVVAWMHSHPGTGRGASHPSHIDHRQDADLRAAYGLDVVGLIVTHDGWLRIWGTAVTTGRVQVDMEGRGIVPSEEPHVYRLAVRSH